MKTPLFYFAFLIVVIMINYVGAMTSPALIELDSQTGDLTIVAPEGFDLGGYRFGTVPSEPQSQPDLSNGQGITVTLDPGQGFRLFGPAVNVGPGTALVQCSVMTNKVEVTIAMGTLNAENDGTLETIDGSLATNQPANGVDFLNSWNPLSVLYQPKGGAVIPVIQAVNRSNEFATVYFDRLKIVPLDSLSSERRNEVLGIVEPTPVPQPTPPEGFSAVTITEPFLTLPIPDGLSTDGETQSKISVGHNSKVEVMALNESVGELYSIDADNLCIVWDYFTGTPIREYTLNSEYSQTNAFFSPSGKKLVVKRTSKIIDILNPHSGEVELSIQNSRFSTSAFGISDDDQWLICISHISVYQIFDLNTGLSVTSDWLELVEGNQLLDIRIPSRVTMNFSRFYERKKYFMVIDNNWKTVSIVDSLKGTVLFGYCIDSAFFKTATTSTINAYTVSEDGSFGITGYFGSKVIHRNSEFPFLTVILESTPVSSMYMKFDNMDSRVMVGGSQKCMISNSATGKLLYSVKFDMIINYFNDGGADRFIFSGDGTVVGVGGDDGVIRLYRCPKFDWE